MAHGDQRVWDVLQGSALEITCACVEFHQVTHVGGQLPDGSMWHLRYDALIEEIQRGRRYYMRFEGNAYLVGVGTDHNGNPVLNVAGKDSHLLSALPRFTV